METTNNLKYTTRKNLSENSYIEVEISLNDERCNGIEMFSIGGKYKDGDMETMGCIHDYILKYLPEFKIFVDLHLSDFKGTPPFAKSKWDTLKKSMNGLRMKNSEKDFESFIKTTGLEERWRQEADEAIKILEELTGKKFETKYK